MSENNKRRTARYGDDGFKYTRKNENYRRRQGAAGKTPEGSSAAGRPVRKAPADPEKRSYERKAPAKKPQSRAQDISGDLSALFDGEVQLHDGSEFTEGLGFKTEKKAAQRTAEKEKILIASDSSGETITPIIKSPPEPVVPIIKETRRDEPEAEKPEKRARAEKNNKPEKKKNNKTELKAAISVSKSEKQEETAQDSGKIKKQEARSARQETEREGKASKPITVSTFDDRAVFGHTPMPEKSRAELREEKKRAAREKREQERLERENEREREKKEREQERSKAKSEDKAHKNAEKKSADRSAEINTGYRKRTAGTTDIRAARRKEKTRKRIKNLIIVLIIAVFALAVYLLRGWWVPRLEGILDKPKGTIVNDGGLKKGNYPLTFNDGSVSSIDCCSDYLTVLDKNQLRIYSASGSQTNSYSHNYADPVQVTNSKRILVFDKGGHNLMVVNRKNEVFGKSMSDRILMADMAKNNYVAAVTESDRYAGVLCVYNQNGTEVFRWSSSARILSITFDSDGDGIFVTTFSSSAGQLRSKVRYFRFDSEEPYMMSVPLPILAISAMRTADGEYWVVGDTDFIKLDENGNIIGDYEYDKELIDFALDEECAALVFKGRARNSAELMIFESGSYGAEPDTRLSLTDGSAKRLRIFDDKVMLLRDKTIDSYSFTGALLATAEISSDHTDFVYFSSGMYFLDYREINKIGFKT
ncbi:MAG: hypothetical protein IJ737_03455 [Ruminococcus sp.]|nr:hypothetical protein [Ruminococcus sp.]